MTRQYCDYLIDQLGSWGIVSVRAMFGGYGIYRNGQIFAIIAYDTLYFKVDDNNLPDYEQRSSGPFVYEVKGKRSVMSSYWKVPLDIIEDSQQLCIFAEKAYQAGLRFKRKKSKLY